MFSNTSIWYIYATIIHYGAALIISIEFKLVKV